MISEGQLCECGHVHDGICPQVACECNELRTLASAILKVGQKIKTNPEAKRKATTVLKKMRPAGGAILVWLCLFLGGCYSIDPRLREQIDKAGDNFDTFAEASQPVDELTPGERQVWADLRDKLKEFFLKAGLVK